MSAGIAGGAAGAALNNQSGTIPASQVPSADWVPWLLVPWLVLCVVVIVHRLVAGK